MKNDSKFDGKTLAELENMPMTAERFAWHFMNGSEQMQHDTLVKLYNRLGLSNESQEKTP